MSEAPKKIWVLVEPSGQLIAGYTDYRSKIKYIRADIVEEMREVLKWIAKEAENYYERTGKSATWLADANAALKRLEEE